MSNYLLGSDVEAVPLVDCVERGRRFARGERVAGGGGGHHHGGGGRRGGPWYGGWGFDTPWYGGLIEYIEETIVPLDVLDVDQLEPVNAYLVGGDILGGEAIGDISDGVTEYDTGERLVLQMNTVFNALHRPKEFEAQAEAVWASYEKAKVWQPLSSPQKGLKWLNATPMKQAGQDAAKLTADLQRAYPGQLAAVPSVNVPKVEPDKSWWDRFTVPTWGWALGGLVLGGAALFVAAPMIGSALAARSAQRLLPAHR